MVTASAAAKLRAQFQDMTPIRPFQLDVCTSKCPLQPHHKSPPPEPKETQLSAGIEKFDSGPQGHALVGVSSSRGWGAGGGRARRKGIPFIRSQSFTAKKGLERFRASFSDPEINSDFPERKGSLVFPQCQKMSRWVESSATLEPWGPSPKHGCCWETVFLFSSVFFCFLFLNIFAYCDLVGDPN